MASPWEVLQQIAPLTRHVRELQADLKQVSRDLEKLSDRTNDRFLAVEVDIATLKAAQATNREPIRAEIATAIADLRVRYAEAESRRNRPQLDDPQS